MSNERPRRRTSFEDLNWLGKSAYMGGRMLRYTAQLVDRTADRVSSVASKSRQAFEREIDPKIQDADVIAERSRSTAASKEEGPGDANDSQDETT